MTEVVAAVASHDHILVFTKSGEIYKVQYDYFGTEIQIQLLGRLFP